jgi:hypothetical protein
VGLFDLAKKAKSSDQTEEERQLASHVRSKVEEVRSSANRIAHEGIWMTNIAYILGYDGLAFNTASRQFQPINRASAYLRKNRLHANKILPTVQNRLAKLCKNPPKFDVMPESDSNEDKEAARLTVQVISALWEKLNVNQKRLFLYMWVQECGHAYVKVFWDTALGKMMVDPETNEMDYEGDVNIRVVSPFEIFPDPMAKTDEELEYVIEAKVRRLDYFKLHYPEKGHLVKQEDAWLLSAQFEQRINSLNSRGPSQGGMSDALKNSAIELIKYEKRSKKFPNGRMIVVANGILLEDKELPVGEIPFAKFDDVIIGGKYYSEAIVTHLRPVQDQYNETVRRRAEWTKNILAGKYIAPRGTNMGPEAPNDQSGEIWLYDPVPTAPDGGRPQPLQVPNIPQWAYMEEDKLTQMMNDISGISEVSRGTLPSASIPALGMQILVEADDTRIGVETEQHEHAWAKVGSLMAKYVEQFYVMPRKLKIAGPNLQYTVKELSGDQLKGNTDVKVIRGSTLPGSKTLKRQEILNAYNQGLLGDPKDPKVREKVLGALEFGDVAEVWADYGLSMAQIKRGIAKLEMGEDVQVNELDNQVLWLQELNRLRIGDKFDSLPVEAQVLINNQIQARLNALVQLSGAGVPPAPQPQPPSQSQALDQAAMGAANQPNQGGH